MANLSDNFDRPDGATLGTASGGGTWETVYGAWAISSHQAAAADPGNSFAVLDAAESDGTVQAKFYGPTSAGLAVRLTDAFNYVGIFVSSTKISLYTAIANVNTGVGPEFTYSPTPGDTIAAVLSGSSVSVKLNGAEIIAPQTVTFNQTETRHGLLSFGDLAVRWDDFAFTGASGGGSISIPIAMFHYRQQGIS